MRIWDINPQHLCRKHLLAEHRELHGLWNILTIHQARGGYSKHPETLRWIGKNKALFNRHHLLIVEFTKRGYNHKSPLDENLATGLKYQDVFINSIDEQREILKNKTCDCLFTFQKEMEYEK